MYQVLYRKWRPAVFEDVVGQPQVTVTLRNEITSGRLGHAYLFTGSRGTGKTTCAKILAKAVNCLHPVNGDPCNECEICKGIDDGSILDVVEIDAASNNGVDNIRDLREEAAFTPAAAKYRVYIIDEAHMLSTGAFNALLKTLEEPPPYVLFILATTEVHKIPATILSRCQRFDFGRISPEEMAKRLEFVAKEEGVALTHEAALLLGRLADGALRDGLSLLDQCIGAGGTVTEEVVEKTAGLAGHDYLFELSDAVFAKDTSAALLLIDRLHQASQDMSRLCEELISHFRAMMLIKTMSDPKALLVCSQQELARLQQAAQKTTLAGLLHILSALQSALERLAYAPNRRVEMELTLIRMTSPELDASSDALLRRVKALETAVRTGQAVLPAAKEEEPSFSAPVPEVPKAQEAPPAVPAAKVPSVSDAPAPTVSAAAAAAPPSPLPCWPEVLEELSSSAPPLRGALEGTSAYVAGTRVLIDAPNPFVLKLINEPGHKQALKTALFHQTGKRYALGPYQREAAAAPEAADPIAALLKQADSRGISVEVSKD
ncbi:MAG: DNA polymerase III subunit gamma/tau [Clostridiales bacterium]|nr:DNA polymerase III subunit gamma/tau [Clostridiales bacterium]